MNEKIFFNDGTQKVPLVSMIGASNEYIQEDNLVALYDRFLLRWHVDYIQDSDNRINLFSNFLKSRNGDSVFNSTALNDEEKPPMGRQTTRDRAATTPQIHCEVTQSTDHDKINRVLVLFTNLAGSALVVYVFQDEPVLVIAAFQAAIQVY